MADISDWSANEKENTHLDELTLSGEGGQYINKIMCAVKAKEDESDALISEIAERQEQVNVGFLLKGTVATTNDLPDDASVGDTYIVSNDTYYYAWNGTSWTNLGINDAGLVHKTGDESVGGKKNFTSSVSVAEPFTIIGSRLDIVSPEAATRQAYVQLNDKNGIGVAYLRERLTADATDFRLHLRRIGDGSTTSSSLAGVCFVYFAPGYSDESFAGKYFFRVVRGSTSSASMNLGSPDNPWDDSYFNNTPTVLSDERLKEKIGGIPDDVLDAWGDVRWVQFKMADAVKRKGESARLHSGLIAQRIGEAFKARGLDASRYGLFCHDAWGDEYEDGTDGASVQVQAAGDRYSLRYEEALCMEAAYQRRRADRLEARLAALEARLGID